MTKEGVCLVTMINAAYKEVGEITLPNMQAYCLKNGYAMEVGQYSTNPKDLHVYGDRGKIEVFTKLFNHYKIIMFLDVDALIMNSDIRIEEVIGPDRDFVWSYDVAGPCSGFWIAYTAADVLMTLSHVKNVAPSMGNVRPVIKSEEPYVLSLEMEPRGQSDQKVMASLMHTPPFSRVLQHCVPGKEVGHCYDYREIGWPDIFEHINHYEPGDWILTYPSIPLERRIELLREAAQKAT